MNVIRHKKAQYEKFKKYIDILEDKSIKDFSSAVSKIEEPVFKKELMDYFESEYGLPLSGKTMTQKEMDEWNAMSDEQKFTDAFEKLPLFIISYLLEGAILIGGTLFILQWLGKIDWFLSKETMDSIEKYFEINPTTPKQDL